LGPHLSFTGSVRPGTQEAQGAGAGTPLASPGLREGTATQEASLRAVLNVNRATAIELERLPGIGPALARRIVADREAQGPFATVAALDRIPGIGPALMARLAGLITAP
jgi:competence protein ComEA